MDTVNSQFYSALIFVVFPVYMPIFCDLRIIDFYCKTIIKCNLKVRFSVWYSTKEAISIQKSPEFKLDRQNIVWRWSIIFYFSSSLVSGFFFCLHLLTCQLLALCPDYMFVILKIIIILLRFCQFEGL